MAIVNPKVKVSVTNDCDAKFVDANAAYIRVSVPEPDQDLTDQELYDNFKDALDADALRAAEETAMSDIQEIRKIESQVILYDQEAIEEARDEISA